MKELLTKKYGYAIGGNARMLSAVKNKGIKKPKKDMMIGLQDVHGRMSEMYARCSECLYMQLKEDITLRRPFDKWCYVFEECPGLYCAQWRKKREVIKYA